MFPKDGDKLTADEECLPMVSLDCYSSLLIRCIDEDSWLEVILFDTLFCKSAKFVYKLLCLDTLDLWPDMKFESTGFSLNLWLLG